MPDDVAGAIPRGRQAWPLWVSIAVLAVLYAAVARASLLLASVNNSSSPVWPASGIAIAALILYGRRLWAGVFLGALAANLWNLVPGGAGAMALPASLGIAAGNTAEAFVGAFLVDRLAGGHRAFDRVPDVLKFSVFAFFIATPISAGIGVLTLMATGLAPVSAAQAIYMTWWLGDAAGAFVVAPLLILILRADPTPMGRRTPAELVAAAFLLVITLSVSSIRPAGGTPDINDRASILYTTASFLVLPALLWPAVRFGPRGAAAATLIMAAISVTALVNGYGSLAQQDPQDAAVSLDVSLCVVATLLLLLGAMTHERWRADWQLEERVRERTAGLAAAEAESRRRSAEYEALAQNLPDLISRFDRAGKRVYANPAAEAMLHKPKADLMGGSPGVADQEKVTAANLTMFKEAMASVFADKKPRLLDVQQVGRRFETRLVPEIGLDGDVATVLVVSRDVTEREKARQELEDRESKLQESQAIAHVGSWEWDIPANKIAWSPELYRIFGVNEKTFPATYENYLNAIHPADRAAMHAVVAGCLKDHKPFHTDHRVVHPDGSVRWVHGEGRLALDAAGNPLRMTGTAQDVTDRHQSEQKFRDLLEGAPDAMVIVNEKGEIVLLNAQTEKLFGHARGELIGKPVEMLIPARFSGHVSHRMAYVEHPKLRPMGAGLDLFGVRKDGSEFPVEISLSPLATPEGTLISASVRDITERKRSQMAVQRSEAMLAEAERLALRGSWEWELATNKITWSPGMEALFGVTAAEGGKPEIFLSIVHPDDRDRVGKAMMETAARVGPFRDEYRIVRKDGSVRTIGLAGETHPGPDGKPARLVGNNADVTEQRRYEESLRTAKEAAEKAATAKGLFLATMSHEIRTPLNAVIGLASVLQTTPLDPHQDELMTTIRSSGEHLLTVINDILDYTKIETGHMVLERVPVEPVHVLAESIALLEPKARAKSLRLTSNVDGAKPPAIASDANRIRQVLLNLLSNAVKFTEAGSVEVSVAARPARDGMHEVEFTVADTGPGIPPERMARLFQPFSQGDASTTRVHGGTGLGLAINRRLVELLGGRIWVESQVGRGSRFHFTVVAPAADVGQRPAPGVAAVPARGPPPALGLEVLLVEDNVVNQKVALQMLKLLACRVDVARDGLEGLERANQRPYDVILMDVEMPRMDGLQATHAIRGAGHTEVRIIAMTAHALAGDRQRCLDAGMDDYLSKPIRLEDLSRALERVPKREAAHAP